MANVTMSAEDQERIKAAGEVWGAAYAAGDEVGMKAAHADAEGVRAKYGFSGGADGSQHIQIDTEGNSEYIKQQAASRLEKELAGLSAAYRKASAQYDAEAEKLPAVYQQAKNRAAAQNALEKRAFDERAVAGGLNSGANAQAQLAMSGTYQSQLGALDREMAGKQSDVQLAKAGLQADYESALAEARAQSEADLADALYNEMLRVEGLRREDRQQKDAWDREDELLKRQAEDTETEYARELALQYGLIDPANVGQIRTLADLAALSAAKQAEAPKAVVSGGGKGYDNGGLTPEQVRKMQEHYGVAVDGMWGPNSQSTTGMSARQAWAAYLKELAGGLRTASTVGVPEVAGTVVTESGKKVDPGLVWEFNDLLEGGIDSQSLQNIVLNWIATGHRGADEEVVDALLATTGGNWGRKEG